MNTSSSDQQKHWKPARSQPEKVPRHDQKVEGHHHHQQADRQQQQQQQRRWWRRTRIHVAILGLAIGVVNCYAQATFCMAIVEMVLPADFVLRADLVMVVGPPGGEPPEASKQANGKPATGGESAVSVIEDQSCPIEYRYRDYYDSWRFPAPTETPGNSTSISLTTSAATGATATTTNQTIDVSNRFDWNAGQQGLLLGAFAVGTAPLQVLGGRLAEIYGAKWVLLAGCLGTALTNLTIPLIARFSFVLLVLNRVLMGVAQAGMEPGLMCLLAEWLTPAETGFFISMLLFAICIGFFLGSLCSSFILALGYGWPLAYYVSGGLNLLVGLLWFVYADSRPRESKFISPPELDYIERQQQVGRAKPERCARADGVETNNLKCDLKQGKHLSEQQQQQQQAGQVAPWWNILSTRSVWAFIVCKISVRWCADVLSNELPLYLANVLHLSIKLNGILTSVSSALFAIFSFITGWLVNELSKEETEAAAAEAEAEAQTEQTGHQAASNRWIRSSIDKTTLRKIFQSVASFGAALCVFLMTRYDCNIVVSMSMLLALSSCLVMGTGGELQIPYDMTSKYPGTLHGMACTLSISGWLAPPLIGLILADQPNSRSRWNIVWYMTATINLIGGLVFVLFADASPRDFDSDTSGREQASQKRRRQDDHHHHQHHHQMAGYDNGACKRSDSSPQQLKRGGPVAASDIAAALNDPRSRLIDGVTAGHHFDLGKPGGPRLPRFRQPEEGFMLPGALYPANMDSPLFAGKLIAFPYQLDEKPQLMNGAHMVCATACGAPRDQPARDQSWPGWGSSWLRPMLGSLASCWSRSDAAAAAGGQFNERVNGGEPAASIGTGPATDGTFLNHDHDQHCDMYTRAAPGVASPLVPDGAQLPIVGREMAANNDSMAPPPGGKGLPMAAAAAPGGPLSPSAFHQRASSDAAAAAADDDADARTIGGHNHEQRRRQQQQQLPMSKGFSPTNNNRPPNGTTTKAAAARGPAGPPAAPMAEAICERQHREAPVFVADQLLRGAGGSCGSATKTITHL